MDFRNKVSQALQRAIPKLSAASTEEAAEESGQSSEAPSPETHIFVPPGHFYSPIVDTAALRRSTFEERRRSDGLDGILIDDDAMRGTFDDLMTAISDLEFPTSPSPNFRFFSENGMYGPGDAIILAAMIRVAGPRRIIEVGSGFSSAVILDTLDRSPGIDASLTCIEPYTGRLDDLLWERDKTRIEIISTSVQDVPLSVFRELEKSDILFLDTTHVSKTGSDVNFEIFSILPILASGVIVHFHDVFNGFEYLDHWIYEENRSWNEIYLIRAFLMYNQAFEVLYFNHRFYVQNLDIVQSQCPQVAGLPGGGLWLRKK